MPSLKIKARMNVFSKRIWILPVILFGIAWAIYWLSAILLGHVQSPDTAYFDYLADAFLHRSDGRCGY